LERFSREIEVLPSIVGLNLPVWIFMVVSIALSSIIAVAGIGYLMDRALCTSGFVEVLESKGLKIYLT